MNQTPNYQLNQWEATDQVLRTDFNADNAKIEAAIKGVEGAIPQIIIDTYTGDGEPERIIPLPFTPRMVVVTSSSGTMQNIYPSYHTSYYFGGVVLPGVSTSGYNREYLKVVENGFKVIYLVDKQGSDTYYYTGNQLNSKFIYIAIS